MIVAVRGLGSPGAECVGLECHNQGVCSRVVLGGVGPALSGLRGVRGAVYGPGAGCHVCGVPEPVGHDISGVLWPRCGARCW